MLQANGLPGQDKQPPTGRDEQNGTTAVGRGGRKIVSLSLATTAVTRTPATTPGSSQLGVQPLFPKAFQSGARSCTSG